MNTTLKVGDWVKFKGTRSFNPRVSVAWGMVRVRDIQRHYVEYIVENTCHADVQTLCRIRSVSADGIPTLQTLDIPAFMLEPSTPFDWTEYDADVAKEEKQ